MNSPFTGKEMNAMQEWRGMIFRNEAFPVLFNFYLCEDTEEKFEDERFSALNYNQVMNQYQTKHQISDQTK